MSVLDDEALTDLICTHLGRVPGWKWEPDRDAPDYPADVVGIRYGLVVTGSADSSTCGSGMTSASTCGSGTIAGPSPGVPAGLFLVPGGGVSGSCFAEKSGESKRAGRPASTGTAGGAAGGGAAGGSTGVTAGTPGRTGTDRAST